LLLFFSFISGVLTVALFRGNCSEHSIHHEHSKGRSCRASWFRTRLGGFETRDFQAQDVAGQQVWKKAGLGRRFRRRLLPRRNLAHLADSSRLAPFG
jgi:hypothetical protein